MTAITTIHRFLGKLLMLLALVGVILALIGLIRRATLEQGEDIFGSAFAGLLDLQALLGLVSFVYLLLQGATGLVTSTWILHPLVMVLALVAVHGSRRRRRGPAPLRHRAQLVTYGASLLLRAAGRMLAALNRKNPPRGAAALREAGCRSGCRPFVCGHFLQRTRALAQAHICAGS